MDLLRTLSFVHLRPVHTPNNHVKNPVEFRRFAAPLRVEAPHRGLIPLKSLLQVLRGAGQVGVHIFHLQTVPPQLR